MSKLLFTVYMKLENGKQEVWEGFADDQGHAVGQAIADATWRTGEQVMDYDFEEVGL
jgi:hypothetical protein